MNHQNSTLRVRFTSLGIEDKKEFDTTLTTIARAADYDSADQCFKVERLKIKKSCGFASIAITNGCCETFLGMFAKHPAFVEAYIE